MFFEEKKLLTSIDSENRFLLTVFYFDHDRHTCVASVQTKTQKKTTLVSLTHTVYICYALLAIKTIKVVCALNRLRERRACHFRAWISLSSRTRAFFVSRRTCRLWILHMSSLWRVRGPEWSQVKS